MAAMSHQLDSLRPPESVALSADPSIGASRATPYRVPELLRAVEVLNMMEVTSSQRVTSQSLGLHQSSVSRILQGLRQELQLVPSGSDHLLYGDAPSLGHLRRAIRAHRIGGGWLQMVADPLHQGLLRSAPGLLPGPCAWLAVERLAKLVSHAVLDGGLVSSLSWGRVADPQPGPPLEWAGLRWTELGELPLRLVSSVPTARTVLVPPAPVAPGLYGELSRRGLALQAADASRQAARSWLRTARSRHLALPLCLALLPPGWLAHQGWRLLPDQPPLTQRLWLLQAADLPSAVQERCLRRLRRRCAAFGAWSQSSSRAP